MVGGWAGEEGLVVSSVKRVVSHTWDERNEKDGTKVQAIGQKYTANDVEERNGEESQGEAKPRPPLGRQLAGVIGAGEHPLLVRFAGKIPEPERPAPPQRTEAVATG